MTKLTSLARNILASTSFRRNLPLLIALFVCMCMNVGAHAQGLVGAPVDVRIGGTSNEIGQLADYGYDTARDISRVVTALSFVIMMVTAICRMLVVSSRLNKIAANNPEFNTGKRFRATFFRWSAATLAVPTALHLVGTFAINNFGGLGGGCP